jgi:quinol monooxygenase YgiN
MVVTVLSTRVAQPGAGDSLVAAILARWQTSPRAHSRAAWVLQGRLDRDRIVIVSEWETPQALAQRPHFLESSPDLARCVRAYTRLTLQRLHFWEDMGTRACLFTCHRLTFPPPQRAQVLHLLQEEKLARLRALPALVLRYLYAVDDEPGEFVVLQGWAHQAAWEEARQRVAPVWAAEEAGLDLRNEPFVGCTRGEWDGVAHRWVD